MSQVAKELELLRYKSFPLTSTIFKAISHPKIFNFAVKRQKERSVILKQNFKSAF